MRLDFYFESVFASLTEGLQLIFPNIFFEIQVRQSLL